PAVHPDPRVSFSALPRRVRLYLQAERQSRRRILSTGDDLRLPTNPAMAIAAITITVSTIIQSDAESITAIIVRLPCKINPSETLIASIATGFETSMPAPLKPVSPYLSSPARTLFDAC